MHPPSVYAENLTIMSEISVVRTTREWVKDDRIYILGELLNKTCSKVRVKGFKLVHSILWTQQMKHCTPASPQRRFVLHCPLYAASESERTHAPPSETEVWMNCTADMTTLCFHSCSTVGPASHTLRETYNYDKPKITIKHFRRPSRADGRMHDLLHVCICMSLDSLPLALIHHTCFSNKDTQTSSRPGRRGPRGKSAHRPGCFSHPLTADVFNYCYKHHFMRAHSASQHTKETKQIV